MKYNIEECKKGVIVAGGMKVRLVYDAIWKEWQVRVYEEGKRIEAATYYTDDKEDAVRTMNEMIRRDNR